MINKLDIYEYFDFTGKKTHCGEITKKQLELFSSFGFSPLNNSAFVMDPRYNCLAESRIKCTKAGGLVIVVIKAQYNPQLTPITVVVTTSA